MSNLAHTVKRTVLLAAEPAEVWEALTDEALLSEWLAPEVELDPRQGGELVCRFDDGEERRGEVAVVEEAERLAFTWQREEGGESWVEWIVDAVADGTRLTVIESGPWADFGNMSPEIGPSAVVAGWAPRLGALRLLLGRLVLA
ncbi:MAG: SRPBCC domain-containing protein [Solirubrobacterales bacterium]